MEHRHHQTVSAATMPHRILMTTDAVGGIWHYAGELARHLTAQGIQVALATMGAPLSDEQRRQAGSIPGLTLHESSYRLEWMQDPWDDVERCGDWLLGLAQEFRPDLVHLNGYAHGTLPWQCPCLIAAHSCVLSWWKAVRRAELPETFSRYRERVGQGLAAAAMITAPTRTMLQSIQELYPPVGRNGRVIHNARSALFTPGKKADFILSVGRLWDEAKNIGALAQVADALPWPIYVAGDEQHPDGVPPERRDTLRRLGSLPPHRLASWFATASIYAHPARYEPFGLTVLEAAMSGCALVLGDIPSLRELWQDAALFVPPDNPAALARAVRSLCLDRSAREALAERALLRSRHFSLDSMVHGYLEAYRALMPPQPHHSIS